MSDFNATLELVNKYGDLVIRAFTRGWVGSNFKHRTTELTVRRVGAEARIAVNIEVTKGERNFECFGDVVLTDTQARDLAMTLCPELMEKSITQIWGYKLVDLLENMETEEYRTWEDARSAAKSNKLTNYSILYMGRRIENCDPYEGDDERIRQATGSSANQEPS